MPSTQHPLAGKIAPKELLIDVDQVLRAYHEKRPDLGDPAQAVAFGTSGHRGSSLDGSFNEPHIYAAAQAVCDYRKSQGITGPLYLGIDTHALSRPALDTTLEVLAANGVETFIQRDDGKGGYTPTPAISLAILKFNRGRETGLADGIVVTPSHNPPGDGGFKYNPPNGGPAGGEITSWIEKRANQLLGADNRDVKRVPIAQARRSPNVHLFDFVRPYVDDLRNVLDVDAIRDAKLKLGVDPMGGANVAYWEPIAETYGLHLEVVNQTVDPTFGFMTLDRDGKIRMDCSSPFAMANLIRLKDRFDIAFGNDADSDRHGIVTPKAGLLNPNHYLAVAIAYLFAHRPGWRPDAAIGKTLVSSAMIDRVAKKLGRRLAEVPVGFKWFVDGLLGGDYGFGGEESAGASFLRKDGSAWTTDKDGIIMCLLAAEIKARTGRDPGELYADLTSEFGAPVYDRIDAPADARQRERLKKLSPDDVKATELAGEPITGKLTRAPGNDAPIGGLKVTTPSGWFAARPSGTENIYKIYMESFKGAEHLGRIREEAQAIVGAVFTKG